MAFLVWCIIFFLNKNYICKIPISSYLFWKLSPLRIVYNHPGLYLSLVTWSVGTVSQPVSMNQLLALLRMYFVSRRLVLVNVYSFYDLPIQATTTQCLLASFEQYCIFYPRFGFNCKSICPTALSGSCVAREHAYKISVGLWSSWSLSSSE